jgi:lantibiotic modifying enzyme
MSGAAGALLIALRWYAQTKDPSALEAAALAALKLKETAEHQKTGVAWNTVKDINYDKRLGGLSHGVTGIAWALSEWAEIGHDADARLLATEAYAYERTLFDKAHGTWVDARHNKYMCHWCHGAVGIGLAANRMRSTLGNTECDKIIYQAQKATWKYGFMNNHCLCHGNLGNSEIFLTRGDQERSAKILSNVLADYKRRKEWLCGLPGSTTTPGLMCGLAGIGYGLLRHTYPHDIPNILSLEVPI